MPLVPNYPADHPNAGQTKKPADYTAGERLAHVRETCREARICIDAFMPYDRVALQAALKMAEAAKDGETMDMVQGTIAYADATEARRAHKAS